MAHPGRVAVIGGGVSGLACAARLHSQGVPVTVYDTGRRAVGGRCSSRRLECAGQQLLVDHACQCFSCPDRFPEFAAQTERWLAEGVVAAWPGVGRLRAGRFTPADESCPRYVGVGGMGELPQLISRGLDVCAGVWVSRVQWAAGKWSLYSGSATLGRFDHIVIAHNGKCADRLMKPSGAGAVHRLLVCQFGDRPSAGPRMQLSSLWVLMLVLGRPAGLGFQGAEIVDCPVLSWAGNNTSKHRQESGGLEAWTLISTRAFGKQHKCPQESIPPDHAARVELLMVEAFERSTGLQPGALSQLRVSSQVQLWGAAVPMSVLADSAGYILDWSSQASICGDWCLAPSLAAAWTSGHRLADALVQSERSVTPKPQFVPVAQDAVIGQFGSSPAASPEGSPPEQSPHKVSSTKSRGRRQRKQRCESEPGAQDKSEQEARPSEVSTAPPGHVRVGKGRGKSSTGGGRRKGWGRGKG